MALSKEELLRPRYKVVADYPLSPYKIGDLVATHERRESVHLITVPGYDEMGYERNTHHFFNIEECKKYPAIFKPLPWYSDRANGELPEYVKRKDTVYRANWSKNYLEELVLNISNEWYGGSLLAEKIPVEGFESATLAEYTQYINQQTT